MDYTLPLAIVCLLSFTALLFVLFPFERPMRIDRPTYEIKRLKLKRPKKGRK
jgi:hypothetical protein